METSAKASLDAMMAPVDRGRIEQANARAATKSLLKAPEQHLQGGNTALNPGAYNFLPIAQTHKKIRSLAKCNKNSNGTEGPSADTSLSGIKTGPVVEDKNQNSRTQNFKDPQAPMWTGPLWRSIVAQRQGFSADKWCVRCTGPGRKTATATETGATADGATANAWALVSRRKKGKATAAYPAAENSNAGTNARTRGGSKARDDSDAGTLVSERHKEGKATAAYPTAEHSNTSAGRGACGGFKARGSNTAAGKATADNKNDYGTPKDQNNSGGTEPQMLRRDQRELLSWFLTPLLQPSRHVMQRGLEWEVYISFLFPAAL